MQAAQKDSQINITLPDGAVRTYAAGTTGMDIATSISPSLAKAALAVRIDGVLSDLSLPIEKDASLAIITRKDAEALEMIRHDAAHVMAEAVQKLFPAPKSRSAPASKTAFTMTSPAISPSRPKIWK